MIRYNDSEEYVVMIQQRICIEHFYKYCNVGCGIKLSFQYQVEYLHRKLEESKETAKKQKEHFRGAIEQLQNKLQDTLAGRKQLLDLRSREMQEQEEMIHKLQVMSFPHSFPLGRVPGTTALGGIEMPHGFQLVLMAPTQARTPNKVGDVITPHGPRSTSGPLSRGCSSRAIFAKISINHSQSFLKLTKSPCWNK